MFLNPIGSSKVLPDNSFASELLSLQQSQIADPKSNKVRTMMNMLKDADLSIEEQIAAREFIEFNADDIIDREGRHIRWEFQYEKIDSAKTPSCCMKYTSKDQHISDLYFV